MKKPRNYHSSIYWNGAVYVIGGLAYDRFYGYTAEDKLYFNADIVINKTGRAKMEIWKIADSPDEFKTSENWPELNQWMNPYLFIVPDSFFPDY